VPNESSGTIFDGLRVVELSGGVSAAFCARLFGDQGADVVTIEPPGGSPSRRRRPFVGDTPGRERSALFVYLNAGKRGVTLDVTQPQGREVLFRLLEGADVLIEDNAPLWMDQHDLRFEQLATRFPQLVVSSITPYGQTGPWREYPGSDFTAQHAGGLAYNNAARAKDLRAEPPFIIQGFAGEFAGGLAAASATMCALTQRRATGTGAHVDVALQEVLAMHFQVDVAWASYGGRAPVRAASASPPIPYVGQQPVADGYVDIVVRTEGEWHKFLEVLGNPEWGANELFADMAGRSQYYDALEPLIQGELTHFEKQRLFRDGQARGVSIAAINTIKEAAKAQHFAEREAFVTYEHSGTGEFRAPGPPVRFAGCASTVRPAPLLGEHNGDVFCDRLGLSKRDLVSLRQAGVI
jgi:crotonobetainyl-CoA:carnitine CoA-transferase CaiB-like acyl-CoA transferase